MGLISVSTAFSRASSSPLAWDWYFSSVVLASSKKFALLLWSAELANAWKLFSSSVRASDKS